MKTLLSIDWESEYFKYLTSTDFEDIALKDELILMLLEKDPLIRQRIWDKIILEKKEHPEILKIANPFYIGFGNPDSDILFLGKEKGFDVKNCPDLMVRESINNVLHWNYRVSHPGLTETKFNELNGYNPFFPRIHHKQKIRTSHTWAFYARITAGICGLPDWRALFENTTNISDSFFNHCFISEINHVPSKYSTGRRLIAERKSLLNQTFFKRFNKVIIGAKGYLSQEEIINILDLKSEFHEIELGVNNQRKIKALKLVDGPRTVIYCDQLSGAAGWTNVAVNNLIKEM